MCDACCNSCSLLSFRELRADVALSPFPRGPGLCFDSNIFLCSFIHGLDFSGANKVSFLLFDSSSVFEGCSVIARYLFIYLFIFLMSRVGASVGSSKRHVGILPCSERRNFFRVNRFWSLKTQRGCVEPDSLETLTQVNVMA